MSDVKDIKWMDLDEFLNGGFLQEANRQFFHPLGLALSVTVDDDGKATGITGLWDYRDDPEGILFGGGIDEEKIDHVANVRHDHFETRCRLFGIPEGLWYKLLAPDVQSTTWAPEEDDGEARDE